MYGRSVFQGVHHTPITRGIAPALLNCWGSRIFMYTPFDAKLPNLMWQHIEGGLFIGSQVMPSSPRGGSQHSTIFRVTFYLCVHPLLQNYQIWHSNVERGLVFTWSATPHPKGQGPCALPIFGVDYIFYLQGCIVGSAAGYFSSAGSRVMVVVRVSVNKVSVWTAPVMYIYLSRGRKITPSNFWSSLLFMRTPFIAQLPKLTW